MTLHTLTTSDLEVIIALVAAAGEQGDACLRKRLLLTRIATLVSADHWLWFQGVVDAQGASTVAEGALDCIEGLWQNQSQRQGVLQLVGANGAGSPFLQHALAATHAAKRPTVGRLDLEPSLSAPPADWRSVGIEDFLLTLVPAAAGLVSVTVFFRGRESAAFDERQRQLVQLATAPVTWLHRPHEPSEFSRRAAMLAARAQETLIHLIAGRSNKEIAEQMGLSHHTVGDYLKTIYAHFDVKSRGELFAKIIQGWNWRPEVVSGD